MTTTTLTAHDALAAPGLPLFFRLVLGRLQNIRHGRLAFILPDGRRIEIVGEDEQDECGVIIVRNFAFARRAALGGDIGFFESYADGDWDTPDLAQCLYIFARNAEDLQSSFRAAPFIEALQNFGRTLRRNTKTGSRRNIHAHYDLGNSFYEKWLDRTMTYSSARFSDKAGDLESAQINKYESLARQLDLKPGERVLEIGSGWGGFAEYAAKTTGASVTGLTISPAQYDYARQRIFKEGLNEKVEFRLQDYRDTQGTFDKIASIEMFEAVGKEYWPVYFDTVRNVLKPGGVAGLQIITIADRFFERYLNSTDFIQRYVFPGGMLPSNDALRKVIDQAGLALRGVSEFGQDYARTLREWHQRFLDAWPDITPLGFDDRFSKLWRFYLAYCEAGFKAGTTNVGQYVVQRV